MENNDVRFAVGDGLLCYHGPMLYEAKCLKIQTIHGKEQYFIHYKGWNNKWDVWVSNDRVMPINTDNMNKMVLLKEIYMKKKKSGSKAKHSKAAVQEKTTDNEPPLVKGRNRNHQNTNQIGNVPSPDAPRIKLKGQLLKKTFTDIESNEVVGISHDGDVTNKKAKLVEVPEIPRLFGPNNKITANKADEIKKVVGAAKVIEAGKVTNTNLTDNDASETGKEIEEVNEFEGAKTADSTSYIEQTLIKRITARAFERIEEIEMIKRKASNVKDSVCIL